MLASEVQNRIKQLNPWLIKPERANEFIDVLLPDIYIHRYVEQYLVNTEKAVLLIGPRQSGKSTLVWHLMQKYAPDILCLNMEDPLLRIGCESTADFVEHFREHYFFVKALFIDEAQHMDEAGLFIKGLVDARLGMPIWVTGSSSFHLKSRTRESLAGRATRHRLFPFSIEELIKHANPSNPISAKAISEQITSHQIIFGSYPAIYLAKNENKKIALLNDLVDALILRDASDLFKIRRIDAFRKLLTLLAGQIGSLVNTSELASVCNVDVGTINAYIQLLEESHIVKKTLPFAGGKRREITGASKVFFIDNGIRNQLLNHFSAELTLRTDKGQLFENWVFTEIHKSLPFQSSLKFWRSKAGAEVDFIIEHTGNIYPVEVKFSFLKQPKLERSAKSFIQAYKPEEFTVINMALDTNIEFENCTVSFITPHRLSQWLSGHLNKS